MAPSPGSTGAREHKSARRGKRSFASKMGFMRIAQISKLDDLAPLANAWNRLAAGVPFRRWEWLSLWWLWYGHGHTMFTLLVYDDCGALVGIAPWYLHASSSQGRVLQFLGTGEVCSDYLGLLCEPGRENDIAAALAEFLLKSQRTERWDLLRLSGVEAGDVAVSQLAEHLAKGGCTVHRAAGPRCWRLELPGDWQEYLALLSKSHRKQVRRVEERLLGTGRARLHTVQSIEELPAARNILIDLHQRRRLSLGEPGCFASSAFTVFHDEVMQRFLATQSLRLHWLELDGSPVAAEYHLAGGGMIYGYQAGVDPTRLDDEPGRLAAIATLKLAIDEGRRAFDFLRGDEPYKAHWRAEPRDMQELRIVPRRPSARLRHTVWLARERVKEIVRPAHATQGHAAK